MNKLTRSRASTLVILCAVVVSLAIHSPSEARGGDGHGGSGAGHPEHGVVSHEFHGQHFHPVGPRRFGFIPVVPFYGYYPYYPPAYSEGSPAFWYYCPSYGAYYPDVASCPEAWVPVPAS